MIVLGDQTDHGGQVVEASGVTDTHGRRIARVGDRVTCPKKGHGTNEIVTGDPSFVMDGKAVAYHGCKTACGATLISSQAVTTIDFGGGGSSSNQGKPSSALLNLALASNLKFEYDEQVRLTATPGMAWLIETNEGGTLSGVVNEDGLLPRLDTYSEDEYTVYWGDEAVARITETGAKS
jgi:uncharacterized Zn-binding protein involved in type VI secretion